MTRQQNFTDPKIDGDLKTVSYIADDSGRQEMTPGAIWDPVHIVNEQAWREIEKQIESSRRKIAAGKRSPLHYHMIANQMNAALLARYTGQSSWRVHLHLLPFFFRRLGRKTLTNYADFFKISAEDLQSGRLKPPLYSRHEIHS